MTDLPERIRSSFRDKKIVIAGDLVADQFLHGTIARVSREAPVFILRHDETDTRPGAAANAAANVAAMGAKPILVGTAGDDEAGRLLVAELKAMGVETRFVVAEPSSKTTTKLRVLAGQHYAARQQVIRIDYESTVAASTSVQSKLLSNLSAACKDADAIVISDYDYGVASRGLFEAALAISHEKGIPLLTDSRHRLAEFPGATAATPNQEEVESLIGDASSAEECESLRRRLGLRTLLVTRGNKGIVLFEEGSEPVELAAVGPTEPVDVTGAGDTVIAAFALGLASGLSSAEAAEVANHAGGIVVMKKGTATASLDELLKSLQVNRPRSLESKA